MLLLWQIVSTATAAMMPLMLPYCCYDITTKKLQLLLVLPRRYWSCCWYDKHYHHCCQVLLRWHRPALTAIATAEKFGQHWDNATDLIIIPLQPAMLPSLVSSATVPPLLLPRLTSILPLLLWCRCRHDTAILLLCCHAANTVMLPLLLWCCRRFDTEMSMPPPCNCCNIPIMPWS